MKASYKHIAGFSFMELVIVLLIAGLLLGGVMTGSKIVRDAQLNTIVEETETIQKGINGFIATYNALPGDISDATDKLGAKLGDPVTGPNIQNGDGDGILESSELLYAFQHLAAAGYIIGVYDGATAQPGVGVMGSATDSSLAYEITISSNVVYIKASKYSTATGYAFFTPQEAYQIDARYDDGVPGTGLITAALGTGNIGNCISASAYDLTNSKEACVLSFRSKAAPSTAIATSVASTGCPDGTGGTVAAASTRTTANCSNYGFAAKALTEVCQTGGYWEVQSGQTCP